MIGFAPSGAVRIGRSWTNSSCLTGCALYSKIANGSCNARENKARGGVTFCAVSSTSGGDGRRSGVGLRNDQAASDAWPLYRRGRLDLPAVGPTGARGLVETCRAASDGGPPPKYYSLSPDGVRALEADLSKWKGTRDAVDGARQSGGNAVTTFVEECCREWRRLGVPNPVANDMADGLAAELEEAQAEDGSPEDVLGNSAFDPRRFAAT